MISNYTSNLFISSNKTRSQHSTTRLTRDLPHSTPALYQCDGYHDIPCIYFTIMCCLKRKETDRGFYVHFSKYLIINDSSRLLICYRVYLVNYSKLDLY